MAMTLTLLRRQSSHGSCLSMLHLPRAARAGMNGGEEVRMRLKKSLAKLAEWERVCRVATVGSAGVPHVVPVCHVLDDGKLYFASEKGARKVRNLRENPHLTVTIDL